jgi:paraquat-inducible protein B
VLLLGDQVSEKINKTAIGAFVLGAVGLLVAAILILGSGKLFTREFVYITYFAGSVKGLSVGAPVVFRGVKVGRVTDISIMTNPQSIELKIPVLFTVNPAKFKGTRVEFQRDAGAIGKAVASGLRTQLQTQSFVTGQLMLSLDFFPEKPAVYVGWDKETRYPEIPSIPSDFEELYKIVGALPVKKIAENLNETLAGIDALIQSIDAKQTTETLVSAVREVQTLVRHVDARLGPVVTSITKTSGAAERTLEETQEAMVAVKGLVAASQSTFDAARAALQQTEATLQGYSPDSPLIIELHKTLRELSATSRSFRNLSDYLERHPESLLRGKSGAKGDLR